MKNTFLIICSLIFISCEQQNKSQKLSLSDSLIRAEMVDSIVEGTMISYALKDTVSAKDAPVLVISAKPVSKEYSNYKDIKVTYKNVSGKNISAIRFKWYGVNAFNEPADMTGSYTEGIGSGFTDDILRAGKSRSSEWSLLSRDLKKVVKAWAYEVAFEDGTKWEIKN